MSSPETEDKALADVPASLPFTIFEQVGAGAAPGGAPYAPAQPLVERQLRDVLGWTPRADDPTGFVNALQRSYRAVVVEGVETWQWAPGGASVEIVDRPELSGGQAALYGRATMALSALRGLIESLEPTTEVADDEQVEAIRAIVLSELEQIVSELGTEGGPSGLLLDGLFTQLLGVTPPEAAPTDPASVGGHLGDLRDRLYLFRDRIILPEEERNYTNWLSAFEYVVSLYLGYSAQREELTGEGDVQYFGTQLVHLRRVLGVVAEGVEETIRALDAVNIGQAERQLLRVDAHVEGRQGVTRVFLQPTLDWIRDFANNEAPQLIATAGRDGAIALYPTLWTQAEAIESFAGAPPGFPALYRSPLVQAAIQSLAYSLDDATSIIAALGVPQPVLQLMPAATNGAPMPAPDVAEAPTPPADETVEVDVEITVVPTQSTRLVLFVTNLRPGLDVWIVPKGARNLANGIPGDVGPRDDPTQVDFDISGIDITGDSDDWDVVLAKDNKIVHRGETITIYK